MRYVKARYAQYQRDEVYRIYVTDSLKIIGKLNERYADVFKPVDPRTADEVIEGVRSKLRKIGGG